MKINEQWLRKWITTDLTVNELAEQMALIGLTVDDILPVAESFTDVTIGRVLSTKPHPDAKRLSCCEVDVGESEPLSIVCGAPNVRPNLVVAVARVGATLPNDIEIKKAKIRGETSEGMLCSATELGLKFWPKADGILELPEDAPIGHSFAEVFITDTKILDVEVTPNRGDCLSVKGIARDVAAALNTTLHDKPIELVPAELVNPIAIDVSAPEACPRYVGKVIKDVDNTKPTPLWMKLYLQYAGVSSVNLVVDVCNFVMLAIGQPMHAFDYDTFSEIHVRRAKEGEQCQLLNEQTITLTDHDLVIADKENVWSRPFKSAKVQ